MRQMVKFAVIAGVMVMLAMIVPSTLVSQSLWFDRSHDTTISLEILKPDFESEWREYTFTTSALFLTFRVPVGENTLLIAELPYAHGAYDVDYGPSESQSTLGNPYLGLEIGEKSSSSFGEVGLRVPVASEDNYIPTYVGGYSAIDRLEAFSSNWLTILGMANYSSRDPSGSCFRIRGGPVFMINTDKYCCDDDVELLLSYSARAG